MSFVFKASKYISKNILITLLFAFLFIFFIIFLSADLLQKNTKSKEFDHESFEYSEKFKSISRDSYILYPQNYSNIDVYKTDCINQKGVFFECGSSCNLKGGEICPSVCELLCKLP
jgi:hypothetical protein